MISTRKALGIQLEYKGREDVRWKYCPFENPSEAVTLFSEGRPGQANSEYLE